MTGALAIIKALEAEKVSTIFGYPGAAIAPFYDALAQSEINHILTRHEQGAAHAASGYARATGKTGVCVASSGPGATNLITGIATAYMDSIPLVIITGQVSSELIGRDVFQEADITGATAPFCKHNYLVKSAGDLPRVLKEAFHLASTGRPGPVLIDIPIDVQNAELDFKYPVKADIRGYKPTVKGHALQIKKVAQALAGARRPVICAGGGVIRSGASGAVKAFAEKWDIPVTTTLMGIGAIPAEHRLSCGMVGMHGSKKANWAVSNSDLLIILGARVGDRAMGATGQLVKNTTIVHIDIDPAEIGKNVDTTIPVVGDVKQVVLELDRQVASMSSAGWLELVQVQGEKRGTGRSGETGDPGEPGKTGSWSKTGEFGNSGEGFVNPKYVMSVLSNMLDEKAIVTTEVGQHQIWAANNLSIKTPGAFISSGGLGTMGYGLPAAIGAKLGAPEKTVVVVSGDGSFQMSMQELGTMKHYGINIKIVLFNNGNLGMVRELQKNKYGARYSQVLLDHNPDFVKIVEAYGFMGKRINDQAQVESSLMQMLKSEGTYLLEIAVDSEEPTL